MKILLLGVILLVSTSAFSECNTAYQNQIKAIEARLNPPRTTVISNLIAEGAVVATLATVGTMPVTAIVALPAAALGAGSYLTYLIAERNGLRNGMHLIRDAHRGQGQTLDRFMKILNRRAGDEVNREEVISFLQQGDFDNKFCVQNEVTDVYKVMSFRKLLRVSKKELAL